MASQRDHDSASDSPGGKAQGAHVDEHSRTPGEARLPSQTDLIPASQLAQFLGVSSDTLRAEIGRSSDELLGVKLDLAPGDVLYRQGCVSHYVYVLQSGLVQCHSHDGGLVLPMTVSYAGAQQWVGLHELAGRRLETVESAVHTTLLAFPVSELRALSETSPLMSDLLARRSSMALTRDLRMAHSLQEMAPDVRMVAGLAHLARLILTPHGAEASQARADEGVKALFSIALLADWLGLGAHELRQGLARLQGSGALRFNATHITELTPRAVLGLPQVQAAHFEQPWSKES